LNHRVIGSRTKVENSIDFCAAHLVYELARCGIASHSGDALRATRGTGCDILHACGNVAVGGWRTDGDPSEGARGPSHEQSEGKFIQFHLLIFSSIFCMRFRATLRIDLLSRKKNRE